MENMKDVAKKLASLNMRVSQCIPVALAGGGALGTDFNASEEMEMLIDEEPDALEEMFPELEDYLDEDNIDHVTADEVLTVLAEHNRNGFIFRFDVKSSENWSSFGSTWIYGETFSESIEKGCAWAAMRAKKNADAQGER